jgi:hypothetical protein
MEPIKFGVFNCPFCGEETPDWRIDCLSCGKIFPPFQDLIPKQKGENEDVTPSDDQDA